MNLSQLNEQVRQALNNRDHNKAKEALKQIDELLNGGKGE
ncbi:hypothetical protein GCM10011409_46040 [Lentibacillus populi]|uniref:Uncharacterized protein n=1 Tax=Lentibacillus populi TaxID=1827502 RepID=A0A9W5X7Y3_9BACI|nr:hypothetical protein GCM10011409_46040 [Lentibacillus populi]